MARSYKIWLLSIAGLGLLLSILIFKQDSAILSEGDTGTPEVRWQGPPEGEDKHDVVRPESLKRQDALQGRSSDVARSEATGSTYLIRVEGPDPDSVGIAAFCLDEGAETLLDKQFLSGGNNSTLVSSLVQYTQNNVWQVVPQKAECLIGVAIEAAGYYSKAITLSPESLGGDAVTVVILQPADFRVVVVSDLGNPLEDVVVHLRSNDLGLSANAGIEDLFLHRWYWRQSKTNSEGRAIFVSPPEGLASVFVEARGGYSAAIEWGIPTVGVTKMTCIRSYSATGIVRSSSGTPISDANVAVIATDCALVEEPLAQTETTNGGRFELIGIPADSRMHYLVAIKEGYTCGISPLAVMQPGLSVEHEFVLSMATSAQLQVVTELGVPIQNTQITVHQIDGRRLPFSALTDNEGVVAPSNLMDGGRRYYLSVNLHGVWVESEAFAVTNSSEPLVVVVRNLSRVVRVEQSGAERTLESASLIWTPDGLPGAQVEFGVEDLPLLLPSGEGRMTAHWKNGPSQSARLFLGSNEEQVINLQFAMATLRFAFADSNVSECRIYSTDNLRAATIDYPQGVIEVQLAPGEYFLYIQIGELAVEVGPFCIPPTGLDLGRLDLEGSSSIAGRVVDGAGTGIAGCPVHAEGAHAYRPQSVVSDINGNFLINSVPPGQYRVWCDAELAGGGSTPDCSAAIFVGCNVDAVGLELVIGPSGTRITISDALSSCSGVRAFAIARGKLFSVSGPRANYVSIPTLDAGESFLAGAIVPVVGGAQVHLLACDAGEAEYYVEPQQLSEYHIERYSRHYSAYPISVSGFTVGSSGLVSDSQETIVLATNAPEMIAAFVDVANGEYLWRYIDDGQPAMGGQHVIRVQTLTGEVVEGAICITRGGAYRSWTDHFGRTRVRCFSDDWLWIDHSAFWAEQLRIQKEEQTVTLRRSTSVKELQLGIAGPIVAARISPLFDLGYDFMDQAANLTVMESSLLVPNLPSGRYRVVWENLDGTMQEIDVELPESGEAAFLR